MRSEVLMLLLTAAAYAVQPCAQDECKSPHTGICFPLAGLDCVKSVKSCYYWPDLKTPSLCTKDRTGQQCREGSTFRHYICHEEKWASCFDSIQNQGETGVDCGGPCSACEATAHLDKYPGYTGDAITGSAEMIFDKDHLAVTINYDLSGVEKECKTPSDASNSCGIHIHSGTSCDAAGGHYFNGGDDPWTGAMYKSVGTVAEGSLKVSHGYDWKDSKGRVLVVHNHEGNRVACAVILPIDACYPKADAAADLKENTRKCSFRDCQTSCVQDGKKYSLVTTQDYVNRESIEAFSCNKESHFWEAPLLWCSCADELPSGAGTACLPSREQVRYSRTSFGRTGPKTAEFDAVAGWDGEGCPKYQQFMATCADKCSSPSVEDTAAICGEFKACLADFPAEIKELAMEGCPAPTGNVSAAYLVGPSALVLLLLQVALLAR